MTWAYIIAFFLGMLVFLPTLKLPKQISQKSLSERLIEAAERPYQAMQDCPHCGHLDIHPFEVKKFLLFIPVGDYLELKCTKCKKDWKQNA